MIAGQAHLIGGLLMGLASSLHCAGQCGGISSSLLLATSHHDATAAEKARALLTIQIGRALAYTLGGAVVGGIGTAFAVLLNGAGAQQIMRMAAACAMIWAGCSIAGWRPGFNVVDQLLQRRFGSMYNGASRLCCAAPPIVLGLVWGLAPCGMVYAALFNAMMTGSVAHGSLFMAGFGLATIPAVAATTFGITALAGAGVRFHHQHRLRIALGSAILVLGLASLIEPAASLSMLCMSR